jgi:hypothetical protein
MRIRDLLPSARFAAILSSLMFSGGAVLGAYAFTHYEPAPSQVAVSPSQTTSLDWKKALEDIQAQNPQSRLPSAPSEEVVQNLLGAATSENVTDTVARTLFVNLSTAKAQGLGGDIPTQDALIADAAAKISQDRGKAVYTNADLNIITDSKAAQKAYGNAFIQTVRAHPTADMSRTLYVIGIAVDYKNSSSLKELKTIGNAYAALARDLAELEVPSTLVPFHLSVVNNLSRMAATYGDMEMILVDPLLGLGGFKLYQSLGEETARVFTSIATSLSKNGILFNTDEPGYTWNSFIP